MNSYTTSNPRHTITAAIVAVLMSSGCYLTVAAPAIAAKAQIASAASAPSPVSTPVA